MKNDSTPSEGWSDKFCELYEGIDGDDGEKARKYLVPYVSSLLAKARQEERREIQQNIKSVLNFLDGDTPKEYIANYIREYLEEKK